MIKQGIEKIENLVLKGTEVQEINGNFYSKERLFQVKPDKNRIEHLVVNSLYSVIKFISKYSKKFNNLEVVVENYDRVVVKTQLNQENERETLLVANCEISHRWLNNYIDPEEMIINLRRNCVETEKLKNVIDIISGISDKAEVQTTDDGIGQKTTIVKGSVVMGQVEIKGIIPLITSQKETIVYCSSGNEE